MAAILRAAFRDARSGISGWAADGDITETVTGRWHLAKSPHFEVLTEGDPARWRSLAEDLERFHG